MASSDGLDATTLVLLLLAAVVLLPLLTMGMGGMMGYGGMMGMYGTGGGSAWWPLLGMAVQLLVLLLIVGGGYLVVRRVTETRASRNLAMEELRMAYARGELTDEEFETRREKLERSE